MSSDALPESVRQWRDGGEMLSTPSGQIFVRSTPGEVDGPAVVLLHGFPSSSYDFRAVVDRFGEQGWLTLDFLGFGLSDKPRPHRYSLIEQADIVEEVVTAKVDGPVVLIAHDMGTSVATELFARDLAGGLSFELQEAVLTNGSVILERASLRPAQKMLRGRFGPALSRLTTEGGFSRGMAKLFSAQHPLSAEEAAAQWALLAHNDGRRILHLLSAYLDERVEYALRWHGAVRDWPKPLSFLWATGDPVATTSVLAGLRELRPAAEILEMPEIGHYPQIEVPHEFAAASKWLMRELLTRG